MKEMFLTNKIPVEEKDLLELFFKGKKFPIGKVPSLDFYNFMKFGMSQEGEQDFRFFMRKTKIRMEEERDRNRSEKELKKKADQEKNPYTYDIAITDADNDDLKYEYYLYN